MNNQSEEKVAQTDVVGTAAGKSSRISKTRRSIRKKGSRRRKDKGYAKHNNGELIRVVKNCKQNDSIFDFIDGSFRRYFLVKRGGGAGPQTGVGPGDHVDHADHADHADQGRAPPPFVFFQSVNAFELKKRQAGEAVFTTLLRMTKANMERLYNESNFLNRGWSDEKKWKELRSDRCKLILGFVQKHQPTEEETPSEEHPLTESLPTGSEANMSFLQRLQHSKGENEGKKDADDYLANLAEHSLVCFVHYRLTADYPPNEHTTICYLYEIQIVPEFTKMGIGKHLIGMLEALCKRIKVHKIVCTVLKSNVNAVSFYKTKCSFQVDESSPDNFASDDSEECEYEILKREVSS
ncbi:N-acetyltransferase, GNAT family, putative [Plasmodium vivax]|nr:N-acetyltransferase, GNAT family, putative [Plasmodium vivax]